MKKIYITTIFSFQFFCLLAETWTINNLPGTDADFNSLTTAIASATDGDSLLLYPTGISYGAQTISKQLFILGPGHFPSFSNGVAAITGTLTLSQNASGTFIKGIRVSGNITAGANTINIVISGCRIEGGSPVNCTSISSTSWILEGNVIISTANSVAIEVGGNGISFIVRNNFLQTIWTGAVSPAHPSLLFDHNIIVHSATGATRLFNSATSSLTVTNNIFIVQSSGTSTYQDNCTNCIWQNNLTYGTITPLNVLPGNNLNNINPMFEVLTTFPWNYSNNYQLQTGSPGENYATDGSDIGIYGGSVNFSLNGYNNALPRIENVILESSSVVSGGTLNVLIQALGAGN